MTRPRALPKIRFAAVVTAALLAAPAWPAPLTPEEARAQAEEAFILVYPMLKVYRAIYAGTIDDKSSEWRAPFNQFSHQAQILGPAEKAVRPNHDVLLSRAALDLRREPLVLSVPALPRERYSSFQFIDISARNFGHLDSVAKSEAARNYLIAGPGWKGRKPRGISEVFRASGNFALVTGRTAVDGAGDLPAAARIIEQYTLSPLSEFEGKKPPGAAPALRFPAYDAGDAGSAGFVAHANFLLGQAAIAPEHRSLLRKFRPIGLYPGRRFDAGKLKPEIREAMDQGVAAALKRIEAEVPKLSERRNGWSLTGSVLAEAQALHDQPLTRAAAAMLGLPGDSLATLYAPVSLADEKDESFNAFRHNYTLSFSSDRLPPVDGFWSLTLYALPQEHLFANSMNRYSLGSRSRGLKYAKDGSLTLYIQYKSPGGGREDNWLPAPNGPFILVLRMYTPNPQALNPPYAPPPVGRP